jgi:predicted nucleotide-binding protein (sugar kinase/HSP70/actin superfamily)
MRIGLPRILGYYYLFPLYKTFLKELEVDFFESPPSDPSDLERMRLCPTDEPCVSVKIAFSHGERLLSLGADALFVPSVISLNSDSYCCPKMIGLPAMLKAGLGLADRQIISPVIDYKDNPGGWRRSWIKAGQVMTGKSVAKIWKALDLGLEQLRLQDQPEEKTVPQAGCEGKLTAVMGHAYILQDLFGRSLLEIARRYGPVVTAEVVNEDKALKELSGIPGSEKMWPIEARILGAGLHLIRAGKVQRLVFVSAFACGPASVIENYVAQEAEKHGVPFLSLAVDEHTGEAGLVTRLEAFMDCRPVKSGITGRIKPLPKTRAPAKKKLGLLNMGNLFVPLSTLFKSCGIDVLVPDSLNERVVAMGKELAPEFMCYPMVTLLGQTRDLLHKGVERIIMVQGKGRCRLGWYAQVMENILHRAGYDFKFIAFDSPFPLREKGSLFIESCQELESREGVKGAVRGFLLAFTKLKHIDKADAVLRELRATEEKRGTGQLLFDKCLRDLERASTFKAMSLTMKEYLKAARDVARIKEKPLSVGVIGEIYVINEPFVNRYADKCLGSFEDRVWVHRNLSVSSWAEYHLLKLPGAIWDYHAVTKAAAPYIDVSVGGHGRESVGEAVLAQKRGLDGLVHLFPFTCMPEIIAQNILVRVSKDLDIPVLSLMISEQTGMAGLVTRLEAFVDLLAQRRKKVKTL